MQGSWVAGATRNALQMQRHLVADATILIPALICKASKCLGVGGLGEASRYKVLVMSWDINKVVSSETRITF